MQVTETQSEGLKRAYSVTLPAAALEEKMTAKLEAARADVQMKGFRKGKAPLPLLKKMFGKSLLGEVLQESVDGAVRQHFEDSGDRPAMQPDIKIANENFEDGQDLQVELSYERLPDVPEVDFAGYKLTRPVAQVEDAAVQEALENLAKSAGGFAEKDGPAETGDQVTFDFAGSIDGEAFEGGAAEDFPLTLGSGAFIPGFEDQLVGASAGEEKEVTVTFPKDYQAEHLAGKEAKFACTIKAVAAPAVAEIDDALAEKFNVADLATLKAQLSDRLGQEYAGAGRALVKRALLDMIDEDVSFELPPTLVDIEAKQIARQLSAEAGEAAPEGGEIAPTEEHVALAARRVKIGLLLAEVGQKNEIEVTEQELNQAIFRQAQQYSGREKEFFDFMRQNPGAVQQVRAPLFEEKVVDFILELAEVEEETVTKDELQARVDALEEDDAEAAPAES